MKLAVKNIRTGEVIKTFELSERQKARNYRDKQDIKYGAAIHIVTTIQ